MNSNIDKLIEKFKGIASNSGNIDVSEALLAGVNAARGEMSFRIFNEGKDAEGGGFGQYKGKKVRTAKTPSRKLTGEEEKQKDFLFGTQNQFSEYELIRINQGRQVRYKDLELTGSLRRGVVSIKISNNKVVCAIPNDALFKIAQYQEEQIGKILGKGRLVIFAPSEGETETLRFNTKEILNQLYGRVLNA